MDNERIAQLERDVQVLTEALGNNTDMLTQTLNGGADVARTLTSTVVEMRVLANVMVWIALSLEQVAKVVPPGTMARALGVALDNFDDEQKERAAHVINILKVMAMQR